MRFQVYPKCIHLVMVLDVTARVLGLVAAAAVGELLVPLSRRFLRLLPHSPTCVKQAVNGPKYQQ